MSFRVTVLMILTLVAAPAPAQPTGTLNISGRTMGTTYSVKVVGRFDTDGRRRVEQAIARELALVTDRMSTYEPESELSRFNRCDCTSPFPLSQPTIEVLRIAREISEITSGAFDITVGPLVSAWGFGATDRVPAAPEPEDLARRRRRVGYRLLALDDVGATARKKVRDVVCDLSAIAKGYAVDRVSEALGRLGHQHSYVEIGGDLRVSGRREDERAWQIAIERPVVDRGSIEHIVELSDLSMATSGDYRIYYESGGKRLSHIIDPRSGHPIAHELASVTVLHRSAAHADALATGLLVLGPAEGLRLAEARGFAAYFFVREADGTFRTVSSSAFRPFLPPAAGNDASVQSEDGC